MDNNNLNRYYSAHFTTPEITSFVYNNGTINGYVVLDGAQQSLPYVRHYQDTNAFWTTTVDFDYVVGGINIYVTNSDFAAIRPETMNFRIVMMW